MNHRGTEDAERGESRERAESGEVLFGEVTERIIGAAIEVHRTLGPGFLESVYENAMAVELGLRGIPFQRQNPVIVYYKDQNVGQGTMDLIVEEKVIVELKAVEKLAPVHTAQVISYLKSTNHRVGLLINFNTEVLKDGIKRIIL